MRMCLIRPPRRNARDAGLSVPPLGLAYIAAAARENGHQVQIIDAFAADWSWAQLERRIEQEMPDVVGMTAMSPMADVVRRAVRMVRPFTGRVVIGGPHPTAVRAEIFTEMPEIDAAVVGEGEAVVGPLLRWWSQGATGDPPPGVMAPDRAFSPLKKLPDPGDIAWPARDLLNQSQYRYLFASRRGFATMITSRGCPFRCSFCDKNVSGSKWRARKAADVVDEMAHLAKNGVGFINFYDDNFTLSRSRVVAICDEILRRGVDIEWKCEGRVDSVDDDLLMRMRRAGCRVVAYGVESANPETLALLRKDIRVEQAAGAFAMTRRAGLRSLAYMILGAPGEDEAAVQRSIAFCREIGADYVQFSSLVPMPGTPLFKTHNASASASVPNPVDADAQRSTLTDMDPEVLARLMRQAWTGFYLRPRPMARIFCDAVNSGSLNEVARMGWAWARWMRAA